LLNDALIYAIPSDTSLLMRLVVRLAPAMYVPQDHFVIFESDDEAPFVSLRSFSYADRAPEALVGASARDNTRDP
jgi:hypothetical protein